MAEFGNHSFSEFETQLNWAFTNQQPNNVLIVLNASGAPRGFAILNYSTQNPTPSCTLSYGDGTTSVSAIVKLSAGSNGNYTLTYTVTISTEGYNPTVYEGVLAHIENATNSSSESQKKTAVAGGTKK
jgi:hypothetical protein